jgi:hypothetical protein
MATMPCRWRGTCWAHCWTPARCSSNCCQAPVVVADQDSAPSLQHAQTRRLGAAAGVDRDVPDQPCVRGPQRHHVRGAAHRGAGGQREHHRPDPHRTPITRPAARPGGHRCDRRAPVPDPLRAAPSAHRAHAPSTAHAAMPAAPPSDARPPRSTPSTSASRSSTALVGESDPEVINRIHAVDPGRRGSVAVFAQLRALQKNASRDPSLLQVLFKSAP